MIKHDPLFYIKEGIDLFYRLNDENKKGGYSTKYEGINFVLTDRLLGQCNTLYSLRSEGIKYENEGKIISYLDLFSATSIFRNILETYLTWNHIYISTEDESQKRAKFILWNLDGIKMLNQFKTDAKDIKLFNNLLVREGDDIASLEKQLEENDFFKALNATNQGKLKEVRNGKVKFYNWKFIYDEKRTQKQLILLKNILPSVENYFDVFFHDLYKYSSLYSHSSYPSAIQPLMNDYNKNSHRQDIDNLNQHSFKILSLAIRDLIGQNSKLLEVYNEELAKQKPSAFKDKYNGVLKKFGEKK